MSCVRGPNRKTYHYKVFHNDEIEYYKTSAAITSKHNLTRSTIYLMCKQYNNPDIVRRKYSHIKIQKINESYLSVEFKINHTEII